MVVSLKKTWDGGPFMFYTHKNYKMCICTFYKKIACIYVIRLYSS